jgi:23S rRNA (guanosine2251-2'-O)-methyltransferase
VVPQRRQALERLVLHATSLRIPVVEVEGGTLTALAGFDGHQGIALAVEPRVYAGIDDVLARAVERGEPPFVLVLDSLEDPQNVGTLLRSAEAAGVHGVIFPTHRQAPLTPAAIKASAGAVEHLLLCPVDDLPGAMSDLRVRGLQIAAAEAEAPLTAAQADLRGPLAIVIGSEGQGLSPAMRRRSDIAVRIPMRGAIGSLNAAVAGSILLFAAVAQRDPAGLGDKPARPAGAEAWPVRNEPSSPRGQSVGLPGPDDPAVDPTSEREPAAGVDGASTRRGATTRAPSAPKPARRTAKTAKTARGLGSPTSEPPTSKIPDSEATPETAKPSRRSARTAATIDVEGETGAGAAEPISGAPAPRRARRKAAATSIDPEVAPPIRRRAAAPKATKASAARATIAKAPKRTKAPKAGTGTSEPADPESTDGDELLPGGPVTN